MIKNIASLFLVFFMSQTVALAKVIELDNQNIEHCQEQLSNDNWTGNVVMLYVKNSPGINQFRRFYEKVSAEYPKRNLFALNVFNPEADAKKNQHIMKTVKACLTNMMSGGEEYMGNINTKTPAVLLYDYNHAQIGLGNHELSTKTDIVEFMGEKTSNSSPKVN